MDLMGRSWGQIEKVVIILLITDLNCTDCSVEDPDQSKISRLQNRLLGICALFKVFGARTGIQDQSFFGSATLHWQIVF